MSNDTVIVFTGRSIDRLLREGGTSSWRLNRNRARQCSFVVCTRNAYADGVDGPEAHHAAFLVAEVRDVVHSPEYETSKNRYLIRFSRFARVSVPEIWKGDRNPIRYSSLDELGIDPETLELEAMPESIHAIESVDQSPPVSKFALGPLTIADAKKGLALTFNVPPAAVEITIRG